MLALVDDDHSCLRMVLKLWSVFMIAVLEGCKMKTAVEECQYFAENVRHRLILHQSVKLRRLPGCFVGRSGTLSIASPRPQYSGRQHPTLHSLSILNLALFRINMRLLFLAFHVPEGSR